MSKLVLDAQILGTQMVVVAETVCQEEECFVGRATMAYDSKCLVAAKLAHYPILVSSSVGFLLKMAEALRELEEALRRQGYPESVVACQCPFGKADVSRSMEEVDADHTPARTPSCDVLCPGVALTTLVNDMHSVPIQNEIRIQGMLEEATVVR